MVLRYWRKFSGYFHNLYKQWEILRIYTWTKKKKNQFTPTASDLFCLMRTFKMSSPIYPFHRNYIINQLQGPNYLITKNVHLFNGGPSNQPVSSRQVKPAPSRYYRHGNLHNVNTNYIISRCLLLWMMSVSL